ncbi:PTP2 [Sanghuangporus weigelae]
MSNNNDNDPNDFFKAAPLPSAVHPNAENIDLFAQAIAGRFSNPDMTKLTARLSPSHPAGPSTPPRNTSSLALLTSTLTPATPLARMSLNRSSSPRQPSASTSSSSNPDFTVTTPQNVSDILSSPKVLVLDIRPHSAYAVARLPHAISLSVPSTLLKRPAFTLQKLATMLPSAAARSRFEAWSSASRILVYDADSTALADGSNLLGLLRKFRLAGYTGDVAWLQGGIQALWKGNRHLIDERSLPDDDEEGDAEVLRTRNLPQAAFQQTSTIIRPSPGSMTVPLPDSLPQPTQTIQTGGQASRLTAANPFYDNIRQNIELSQGITERIPLRLSSATVSRTRELPFSWLRNIAKTAGHDEGTEALAMQFYRIELGEQRRLQGIMTHHSRQSGTADGSTTDDTLPEGKRDGKPFPYSIVAGIEKGTKNRYRNIWPFEHSRVHLKDTDHDDYVNASFVHPLGTRRKFIATQGPLPSTFADFWSVVWQQEVHIILMLTKEYEGGSIKCGKYWSDGQYGPLRLKCISVSGATDIENSEGGGEFFSAPHKDASGFVAAEDKENNLTIRRTFELSHVDHPELPPRNITQLQYLGWPDMDVPVNPRSLLRLLFEVDEMTDRDILTSGKPSPILLHCSAGVGRTGAFIMIDAALDGVRREIRKRVMARMSSKAGTASLSNSSGSDGEAQSDSDAAMDVDSTSIRVRSPPAMPTPVRPSVQSQSTVMPPTAVPPSLRKETPATPAVQTRTGPLATLHIGDKKHGQADIHVPLVPSNEIRAQRQASSHLSSSSAGPSNPPGIGNTLLRRRMTRTLMQRPVKSDFTIADADSMFMDPTPDPAFAMDVHSLSRQVRNSNSSSGEGTTSSGDKPSGSLSSGSASDGRLTDPLQKAFSGMSSTDDSPGSPERLKISRFKHRVGGSDGTGSGEGPGESASESSGQSSSLNRGNTGGYSSSSSVGLGAMASLAVASPSPSSGHSSHVPSRPSLSIANRGRHRTSRNLPMQRPSLLAPKPLHLKLQMPELTEGVETNIQSASAPITARAEPHASNASVRSNLSSSSSTDTSSHRNSLFSGHTTDTYDTPPSMLKASRSPSEEKSELMSEWSVFDYAEPRELHGDDSPPLLSSLEEPLRQILEDMREQRMSLCQSLRQYVFVHNAIIEGALVVAEQEQKRLGLDIREVFDPDSPPLIPTEPSKSPIHMTGKRGASPTELPKEDKKGDVALAKRPSVKRGKSLSGGESSSSPASI